MKQRVERALLLLTLISLAVACGSVSINNSAEAPPPNIVLIFADDLGYGDVSSFDGGQKIKTPNLDGLAAQGMRLTDAHTASAVCTPSRYALLTGRYSWRSALKEGVLGGFSLPLIEKGRLTLGRLFKEQGYATACIGKWHLGLDWARPHRGEAEFEMRNDAQGVDFNQPVTNGPLSVGFDHFFGIAASLDMPPYAFIEDTHVTEQPTSTLDQEDTGGRDGPAVPGWRHKFVLGTLTDKAIEFVRENKDRPFFLYHPLNAPHTPHAPADAFLGKSGLDTYGDFVVEVDYQVGRILKTLEIAGLSEKTLVIVTSDNGPEINMFPRKEATGHDGSSHFLGAKRDNWEGGHRVPFIARWPGVIRPGSVCDVPFSLVDMMATFADILGTEVPEDQGVDSVTILPLLRGEEGTYREAHAIVHHSSKGEFGIRKGEWKLLLHPGSGGNGYARELFNGTLEQAAQRSQDRQLFNLRKDSDETTNLASEHPEIVKELMLLAAQYVQKGRSTPGAPQTNALGEWPQLGWLPQPIPSQE